MSILIMDSNAEFYAEKLAQTLPELDFRAAVTEDDALAFSSEATALIGLAPYLSSKLISACGKLEWIQALTTGVDNLKSLKGIAITNCHGIHGPQMSELAVMMMLAVQRNFPKMLANQNGHAWERWPQPILAGKTACIVGVGAIGEHLAGLLGAFGVKVTGVSGGRAEVPGFKKIYTRERLLEASGEADFLILLTPYTPETHHIVDARVIAAMKPTGILINISRGGCLDEESLIDALRADRIAGAALDVFARSPLPPGDPLWDLPNLIVTPHIGGFSDVYREQALPILETNVAAYAAGGVAALEGRLDQ
ncbi:D-2-hydroxyacid dehydrogenase [Roseibium marinum]|uniref:D-2-hydroxyacid dehydrogenase (NADP+) n=1 Tax=Roseibium marinum TaxID=281252 RepID=A0A2S3UJK0_9HYPH|nr:D-2-hydroxyacid dehydrogenase [Roseibium marinum]POF27894.1 D-2-hydroxyacid dehydrogenase (NADP+) [Roseibium marinum]